MSVIRLSLEGALTFLSTPRIADLQKKIVRIIKSELC